MAGVLRGDSVTNQVLAQNGCHKVTRLLLGRGADIGSDVTAYYDTERTPQGCATTYGLRCIHWRRCHYFLRYRTDTTTLPNYFWATAQKLVSL